MTASLEIGGLVMRLEGDAVSLAMRLPGMTAFATNNDREPHMLVHLDATVPPPDCRWLHCFSIGDGEVQCRFGVDADGNYYYHFEQHGTLRIADGGRRPDAFAISHMPSPSVLRFALWAAYGMGALWHHRLPVHASTVVCNGHAVLCLGESGTGKSTHTGLWLQHIADTYLLNDDSPILTADGTVYGSPWSGKTHCYLQEHHPATALLRLEQRPSNSICRLGILRSFAALQPSCPPCLMKDASLQDALVDYVGRVIAQLPVYRLGCLPDAAAAHLAYNTVMAL